VISAAVRLVVMTTCAITLAANAIAEPRGASTTRKPPTPEQAEAQRVQTVKDMETWLRRLTGRFHYQGIEEIPPPYCTRSSRGLACTTPKPRDAEGTWDCVNIGNGAGVHCIIGSTALRRNVMRPNMDSPVMLLFGINPDKPEIRYMRLDEDGIASESTGYLKDDKATFRTPCVNPATTGCTRVLTIEATPGKPVRMTIDVEMASEEYNSVARLQCTLRPPRR